jgi:predicted metalloprotease with PDZ domain
VARFWEDGMVRVLPYDRGAMYFAVLNGKVKRASGGTRSIDDLIREMIVLERRGQPISEDVWVGLLRREFGEEGPAIHTAMTTGAGLMLPQSDDFGPCFRRITQTIRVFEPGFDIAGMSMGQMKVVRGLKPGSEAARAGLREGDQIVSAPLGDKAQLNHRAPVTVKVTRAGGPLAFTYLPRGDPVEIYQWERVAGVPESNCR